MSGSLTTKTFIERSRSVRKAELDRLARDTNENLGLILGLSSQINGTQAHVDYVGGLDTDKLWTGLAKLVQPRRWEVRFEGPEIAGKREERDVLPPLREALIDVAPLDLHRGRESKEEREKRRERKRRDFAGILAQVDTKAIAYFARDILQNRRSVMARGRGSVAPLRLPLIRGPRFGSAHVFYSIEFFDGREKSHENPESKEVIGNKDSTESKGTKWMIKIPVNGTPDTWDQLCAETLRTEALVLYMLATETSIPVPEIIDADSSPHNQVHVPYLIMEYIEGQPLDRVWFGTDGEDEDEGKIRERRTRALRGVAKAMLQLGKYEFERGGAPVFDGGGALVGVGPLRDLDVQAMIDRWFGNEDCERAPLYASTGPSSEPVEMYTALLDLYPCDAEANTGVDRLLRMLVRFIREPVRAKSYNSEGREKGKGKEGEEMGFVLMHPGLNMRDVIVSEKGDVKAILGWDGVRVAPKSLGNEALPSWLVRDFNPFIWRWQPAPEFWTKGGLYEEESGENCCEDAPWVLRELRDEYADIIQELKRERRDRDGDFTTDVRREVDVTKQSLLALSLDAAVRDPRCRTAVLRRILEKCSRMTEEFDFDRIVEVLGRGGYLDGYKLKCLERNFRELVERGYVRGAVVW
ncbi:hypothetical protein F5Y06DRAFT_303910 [Hypoxylon sp. FL0890]|nr:hypothetical protein F5Y06DRAFT_303910 [Hypoxylon sp. FL0890]